MWNNSMHCCNDHCVCVHGHNLLPILSTLHDKGINTTLQQTLLLYTQVVPEYERAVVFRLGRLANREAKGPGTYTKHLLAVLYN